VGRQCLQHRRLHGHGCGCLGPWHVQHGRRTNTGLVFFIRELEFLNVGVVVDLREVRWRWMRVFLPTTGSFGAAIETEGAGTGVGAGVKTGILGAIGVCRV
jgi:hypothetical protein